MTTDLEPIETPESLYGNGIAFFRKKAEEAVLRLETCRRDDCPRCDAPSCSVAVDCAQRGAAVDHNDKALCKWASSVAAERAIAEQIAERTDRLTRARVVRPDLIPSIARSNVPPIPPAEWYGNSPTDLAAHARARQLAAQFVSGESPQTIVLFGRTGTGKSVLAAWIFSQMRGAIWVPASKANDFEQWNEVRPLIDRAPCIVFDDVGRERDGATHFAIETLAETICAAVDDGRRVVLTTNIAPQKDADQRLPGFVDRYGSRVYSRLFQRGAWLTLGNRDLRVASVAGKR